jgi:hypothetical protein
VAGLLAMLTGPVLTAGLALLEQVVARVVRDPTQGYLQGVEGQQARQV